MANSSVMCNCEPSSPATGEYYSAFSDIDTSTPQEWRTATEHPEGQEPEYISSTPRRTPRRGFKREVPRGVLPKSVSRRLDLTTGVAIVPRRIDFDAILEPEDFDDQEDLGAMATETLQRLRSAAGKTQRPACIPESGIAPETYRLRRARPAQYPQVMRQYAPRMTRMTPCGKCLRI